MGLLGYFGSPRQVAEGWSRGMLLQMQSLQKNPTPWELGSKVSEILELEIQARRREQRLHPCTGLSGTK